ncbi:MFS transporter [Streptomyces kanamyceticus]|uniref:MFS transporter n=1 Tax=Streptomyces kanamyceticus TaxID=1967 RepID=A0A5J6GDM9_STRKN|nr:MFS transporter [Streptomyces kanamyceticus]QEU91316.1 MFS transporter [Streptomyces kanamyceticus]
MTSVQEPPASEAEETTAEAGRGRGAGRLRAVAELPRAVKLGLATLFVMNAATYVAFPLLAVKLTTVDHASAVQIGTTLTVFLLAARLTPVVAGPLADRYDPRIVMAIGALARAIGFLGLGLGHGTGQLLVSAFLAGVGAIYEAPVSAMLAAQPEPLRSRAFALENALLNAGVIGGPALAAALLAVGPRAPFVASGVLFVLLLLVVRGITMPGGGDSEQEAPQSVLRHFKNVLGHRWFVGFWLLMLPWWFLFTQLGVAVPLRSDALADTSWISVLYLANGVVGITSILFVKRLHDRYGARMMPALGYLLVAVGFGSVSFGESPWWLLACVAVYSVGETVILFSSQLILASFAGGSTRASFFGIYAGSWALGGSVGNYAGSRLAADPLSHTPWLLFGAVGLVAALVAALTFSRREI